MKNAAVKSRLVVRFTALLTAVLFVSVGVYCIWSITDQRDASERKVLQEARLLTEEMNAAWDYIDSVQPVINYDATGRYDFKGVYCSMAGKSIASRFTFRTDCVIRYTRDEPRTGSDAPDAFEKEALEAFAGGAEEYYAVSEYDGQSVFRYVAAIEIVAGCLPCHGDPAGEVDETGYPREGMQIGDLAGATSLIIPMAQYDEEAAGRIASSIMLFCFLVVAIAICVGWGLRRWVIKPLGSLSTAARRIGEGCFADGIYIPSASFEIASLVRDLGVMSGQLRSTYSDLETRVADRTAQLSEANETLLAQSREITSMNHRLQEANRLLVEENEYKSIFLATMTHELRTPLVSIIAFSDVWFKESVDRDPADMALMRSIRRRSGELLETINNTLDAASIEADRFQVDKVVVDIYDLAGAVGSVVSPLAAEKGLRFSTAIERGIPLVLTDQQIVHKILINLLGNAVKFTEAGGDVSLEIVVNSSAGVIEFSVADTGIGIPEDDLRIIFECFRQADSSISRKYGGSGLGLFLAREMAELLDGSLRVDSSVGKGSVFVVTLPYEPVKETENEDTGC